MFGSGISGEGQEVPPAPNRAEDVPLLHVETAVQARNSAPTITLRSRFSPPEELCLFLTPHGEKVRTWLEKIEFLRQRTDSETVRSLHHWILHTHSGSPSDGCPAEGYAISSSHRGVKAAPGKSSSPAPCTFRGAFASRPFVAVDCGLLWCPPSSRANSSATKKGALHRRA